MSLSFTMLPKKTPMLSLLLSLMLNLTGQLCHPISRRHYRTQKDNKPYCLGHRISNLMRLVISLANLWLHTFYKTSGCSVSRDPQASASQPGSFQTGLRSSVWTRMLITHCNRTWTPCIPDLEEPSFMNDIDNSVAFCSSLEQSLSASHTASCGMRPPWPWWPAQTKEDSWQSGEASFRIPHS